MIGSKKPWLQPEKTEEYLMSTNVWWEAAMETPSHQPYVKNLLDEFTRWTRKQLRYNQWHLPFSFGKNFRKRQKRIRLLKRLLHAFENGRADGHVWDVRNTLHHFSSLGKLDDFSCLRLPFL